MFEATAEEIEAVETLREQGHRNITWDMVDQWIGEKSLAVRMGPQWATGSAQGSEAISEPPVPDGPVNPGEQSRKRGRPAKDDAWIIAAAQLVAEGFTLTKALRRLGIILSRAQRKNIYRLKRFREALQLERERLKSE